MRSIARALLILVFFGFGFGCGSGGGPRAPDSTIVVANRGDGTLTVIDAGTLRATRTVPLPAAANASTPGYVVWSETHDRLYVGDDANSRIVVLSAADFSHVTDMPAVADVFHIWHNESQLWAVDRTSRSVAVFDLATNTRTIVVPIPGDLQAAGGVPHDVVVDDDHAYVSVLGVAMAPDEVVQYSTTTFTETGRASVGEDPHLFLHPTTRRLYVACQESDAVYVLHRDTLAEEDVITVDGGHGVWIPPHGQRLYVTNFAGHEVGPPVPLGAFALFTIDLGTNVVVDATHANESGPHNLASNASGTRLFVTHSNGGTSVAVFTLASALSPPRQIGTIASGTNPFGICRIR